jgi:hypothetical protein
VKDEWAEYMFTNVNPRGKLDKVRMKQMLLVTPRYFIYVFYILLFEEIMIILSS